MDSVLPIGTIIEISSMPLLIVGYQFIRVDNQIEIGYLSEIYPVGFVSEKSILCIPQSKVERIAFEPKIIQNGYTEVLQELLLSVQSIGEEKANKVLEDFLERGGKM